MMVIITLFLIITIVQRLVIHIIARVVVCYCRLTIAMPGFFNRRNSSIVRLSGILGEGLCS